MERFEIGNTYLTVGKGQKFKVVKREGDLVTFRGKFGEDRTLEVGKCLDSETCFVFPDKTGLLIS